MSYKRNIQIELEFLRDWCFKILDVLTDKGVHRPLCENLRSEVNRCFESRKLSLLRDMYRQIYSIVITSPHSIRSAVDSNLKNMYGKSLEHFPPKSLKEVKLTDNQEKELRFIKDWCIEILSFINRNTPGPDGLRIYDSMKATLTHAFEHPDSKTLEGFKMAFRDTNEWAQGLSPDNIKELNLLLKEKFNRTLSDIERVDNRRIKKIIKRGKIENEAEFRLLEDKVSELSQTGTDNDLVATINMLLIKYNSQ